MWPTPDDPRVTNRMRAAHDHARTILHVQAERGAYEAWGWCGRTLGRPVTTPDGPAWLRVASAPSGQIAHTFWDGSLDAERHIPATVPRPKLRDVHDWSHASWEYRAELFDRITVRPIAPSPTLTSVPAPPPHWWTALRTALTDIAGVRTRRYTIRQRYLDEAMPRFLGTPIDTTAKTWTTAHGDLHWTNLCGPTLHILDWEGWGLAPTGYDAATLHSYSLLTPSVADRVYNELGHQLDTPTGHFAELVAITELLHSTQNGDNLELIEPLRARAAHLLDRPVPPPVGAPNQRGIR